MELDRRASMEPDRNPPQVFDCDLVLPPSVLGDLVAAADILTALGRGSFTIAETDHEDPDGIRVHYRGDREFTEFASLADALSKRFQSK